MLAKTKSRLKVVTLAVLAKTKNEFKDEIIYGYI